MTEIRKNGRAKDAADGFDLYAGADAELLKAHRVAMELADWALAIMRDRIDGTLHARNKSSASDWVTEADLQIEQGVRERLHDEFPEHGVTGEEAGISGSAKPAFMWFVDPIDGTCNYAHGIRWNSFSLALLRADQPLVGVLGNPYDGETFHAVAGHGAHVGRRQLQQDGGQVPRQGGIVLIELANHRYWPGLAECLRWLEDHEITARIMGSSALSVAHVAAGRAAGALLGGSHPIDIGAAMLIAREAGARAMDRYGESDRFPQGGVAVAHPLFLDELWRSAFGTGNTPGAATEPARV
ncbi:MAG: inositol monophosphatase [Firmicutes bacterium]|nr:inositol monophosphatase [Bacillota bacterium]